VLQAEALAPEQIGKVGDDVSESAPHRSEA
jgi:hypothetical protein